MLLPNSSEDSDIATRTTNRTSLLDFLSRSRVTLDICSSDKHVDNFSADDSFRRLMSERHRQGLKQRIIANITSDNLEYCKDLAAITDLRHTAGIRGLFLIADGKVCGASSIVDASQRALELVQSDIVEFVEQQKYLFEMMWDKAIHARHRIMELEDGIPIENTELIQGTENIIKNQIDGLASAQKQHDACCDQTFPASLLSSKPVWDMCLEMKKNGILFRTITEITPRNIEYCKQMMTRMQLRHLNDIKGNFSVKDKVEYRGAATMRESEPPTQGILSTAKVFVDMQQLFFETLWNKAIPAEQRIREIEEGISPEILETFNDAAKTQELANNIVNYAKKELLVMFASINEYRRQLNSPNGFLKTIFRLSESSNDRINIRISIPKGETNSETDKTSTNDTFLEAFSKTNQRPILHRFEVPISTMITIIIVDRKYALIVELKDDSAETVQSSSGLAIYSNNKAIVSSYASIFELLWMHIELYGELKAREVAQKEFIDIAVHELRTPIQPILGLAEEIQARQKGSSEGRMLGIILRSASNLKKLADNLLDVARIQNNSLRLTFTHFDLNELISFILRDHAIDAARNKGIGMEFNHSDKPMIVQADKDRLYQVISNCLQNAIKFSENGRIIISSTEGADSVIVSIKDNGTGIDPEILPKLFTKFATSSPTTGTGLGLFITKRIVEAHGGQISGTNNIGGLGATFTLTIPYIPKSGPTLNDNK